jgi:hypothetical protein
MRLLDLSFQVFVMLNIIDTSGMLISDSFTRMDPIYAPKLAI